MKKILLATILFFSAGGVLMAQQKEPKKTAVQKKSPNQIQKERYAKIIALKEAKKKAASTPDASEKFASKETILDNK